jgi:flagellum-specific ATP synthase
VMHDIVPPRQMQQSRTLKRVLSTYEHNRDLVAIGAYRAGSDPRIDAAIAAQPAIQEFMRQDLNQRVGFADSVNQLERLIGATE